MSEWNVFTLEAATECFIDYRGKTPPKTNIGIPLITAKIVKGGRILKANEFIAEDIYDKWMTRGYPKKDDVVLTTEAPLGEVGIITDEKIALAQRIILLRAKEGVSHGPFIKYYLQSREGQASLHSRTSGTTVEGIKSAELKKVEITLPDLAEQKAIAGVLGSLDEMIDLLNRNNLTLEQMAGTLFRQWFVIEAGESWEPSSVGSIAKHLTTVVSPFKQQSAVFSHYSLPAFDNGMTPEKQLGVEILSNKFKVESNTILVSKLNPTVSRIWCIVGEPEKDAICSTEFQVLKPNSDNDFYFLSYFLRSDSAIEELARGASGTSGSHQRISPKDILNLKFKDPPNDRKLLFKDITLNMMQKVVENRKQVSLLQKLRDSILPKLMSGEVQVHK